MSEKLEYGHHLLVVLVVVLGGRYADFRKRRGRDDDGYGKTASGNLNNRQPKAPDVRLDGVLVSKQTLGLHRLLVEFQCKASPFTAMYDRVPTKVAASEFVSSPLTPKSHSFTWPFVLTSMFEGLMSRYRRWCGYERVERESTNERAQTSMHDAERITQVDEAAKDLEANHPRHVL